MAINYSRAALLIPFLATTIGCISSPPEETEEIAEATQEIVTSNRLTMNRLTMNRLTMNSLSAAKLSKDGKKLTATNLVNSEDGRDLLHYIVRCALPESASLSATVNNTTYVFQGLIGLAPTWLQSPLSVSGRRWITACLLAHVNGFGVQVPISVRGNHPALTVTQDERDMYGLQEVSFFGDIFSSHGGHGDDDDDGGAASLPMYACGGQAVQSACGGETSHFRAARSCASADECDIQFVGACNDESGANAHVCGTVLTDGYSGCHTAPKNDSGYWPYGQVYNEVITVYLSPDDFSAFYTSCTPLATQ